MGTKINRLLIEEAINWCRASFDHGRSAQMSFQVGAAMVGYESYQQLIVSQCNSPAIGRYFMRLGMLRQQSDPDRLLPDYVFRGAIDYFIREECATPEQARIRVLEVFYSLTHWRLFVADHRASYAPLIGRIWIPLFEADISNPELAVTQVMAMVSSHHGPDIPNPPRFPKLRASFKPKRSNLPSEMEEYHFPDDLLLIDWREFNDEELITGVSDDCSTGVYLACQPKVACYTSD
jgi:hypothetical protein